MSSARAFVIAALLLCAADSARAEIIDSSPNGFTLSNQIEVEQGAMAAFRALIDNVDQWWPRDHTRWGEGSRLSIEAKAGGCFCERKGDQKALHMSVNLVDPGKLLRMTGGLGPLQGMGLDGVLEFRFATLPSDRTSVTMYYRAGGYTPDDLSELAPIVDRVQALQIGGLAAFLNAATQREQ